MKIILDDLKAHFLRLGRTWGASCGAAWKRAKEQIENWGGEIVVVYGPPGAGKSRLMERVRNDSVLWLEVSGLSPQQNSFLLSLPIQPRITYIRVMARPEVTYRNIEARTESVLDKVNGKEYLHDLDSRWRRCYNGCSWKWALPVDLLIENEV